MHRQWDRDRELEAHRDMEQRERHRGTETVGPPEAETRFLNALFITYLTRTGLPHGCQLPKEVTRAVSPADGQSVTYCK